MLWICNSIERCPTMELGQVEWDERAYFAYNLLYNSIKRHMLRPLLIYTMAWEIWKMIFASFEHKSDVNIHKLQCQFFNARIEEGQNIIDFFGSLQLILSELKELGDRSFSDAFGISKLTTSLPSNFNHFTIS